jgi:hypothetical protein
MDRKQRARFLRVPVGDRKYNPIEKPILKEGGFGLPPTDKPCRECPLARAAVVGALGGYTVAQYLEVLHGIADLACHLSRGFPNNPEEQRSCTGVAMFRANLGIEPWGKAMVAVSLVGVDRETVFASDAEFSKHHGGNLG